MENLSLEVYYLPSAAGSTSSFEYGATYTGIDGLTIGYAGGDNETTATATVEGTNLWATYVYDSFTIGAQRNETDSQTALADSDFDAYGVSYAVNDDFSIGYSFHELETGVTNDADQKSTGISFSYTSGGITLGGAMNEVDNMGGTGTTDREGYEFGLSFAF